MDKKIILQAAKGDVRAFRTIFDFYVPKMRPVSMRYAYSHFEADDILQEAFVKIFRYLKDFKFEGSFEGWIRRIVVHTALNHYKSNRNFYHLDQLEDVAEEQKGWEEIETIEEAEPSQLMKVIEELPEGYRIVFNLYVLEDIPHKEIAEMLGISEGTSRSQYSKAKKMIKKLLSGQRNVDKSDLVTKKIVNG